MQILFILEIIGTIAFAISGAIVGIQKKMDIFGVSILGLTAAVGGGIRGFPESCLRGDCHRRQHPGFHSGDPERL